MNERLPYPDRESAPIGPDEYDLHKLSEILTKELVKWKVIESPLPENPFETRKELYREYWFDTYVDTANFIAEVVPSFDVIMHHPRWENLWKRVRVYTTTWDIGHKISDRDLQLARYLEKIYNTKYSIEDAAATEEGLPETFVRELQGLIADNKIKEAIGRLNEYFLINREKDAINQLTMLSARFNDIDKGKLLEILSHQEFELGMNKIRYSLLRLLDEKY